MTKRKPVTRQMAIDCLIDGCGKRARSRKSAMCEMHYYRQRRALIRERLGLPPVRQPHEIPPRIDVHGYRWIYVRGHPLVSFYGKNQILEHRVVLYDAKGYGPFRCHWCGAALEWETMDIDHIDENKLNNKLENLAPSCPICNRKRGLPKQIEGQRRTAPQYTYDGLTLCAAEWAERIGITPQAFSWRLKNEWVQERLFRAPRGNTGPRRHA
jgi:hypothetical protein